MMLKPILPHHRQQQQQEQRRQKCLLVRRCGTCHLLKHSLQRQAAWRVRGLCRRRGGIDEAGSHACQSRQAVWSQGWIGNFSGSFIVFSSSSPNSHIRTSLPWACSATRHPGSTALMNDLTHKPCAPKPFPGMTSKSGKSKA